MTTTPPSATPAPDATPPSPAPDRRSLDRALVKGVAWTGLARWGTQIFSWAATLLIARLLTKTDYGLVGYGTLYIGFVQLVNEFGVGAAIVKHRELEGRPVAELGGISLAVGIGFWALSCLLGFPLAWFFNEPKVAGIVAVLGVTFVTSALRTLPRALLTRELEFRTVAMVDSSEGIVSAAATLTLALLGWGYWSLVLGGIIGSVVATAVALKVRPHPLAWPSHLRDLRGHLTFGTHVMGGRVAWYGYSNADFFVVGKVLGTAALGAYNFGWTIATIPVGRITGLLGQVVPGIFSAVQDEPRALRRYLLLLTEGVAFFAFPMAAGLALVARDLVEVGLGPEWTAAIVPLQVLAAYSGVRSIAALLPFLLQAVGRAGESLRFSLYALVLLPPAFWLGTHWGLAGVGWAWVIGYPVVAYPMYRLALQDAQCSWGEYFGSILPAVVETAVMCGAVLAWQAFTPTTWPGVARLVGQVVVGGVTYAALAGTLYRKRLLAVITTIRQEGSAPAM